MENQLVCPVCKSKLSVKRASWHLGKVHGLGVTSKEGITRPVCVEVICKSCNGAVSNCSACKETGFQPVSGVLSGEVRCPICGLIVKETGYRTHVNDGHLAFVKGYERRRREASICRAVDLDSRAQQKNSTNFALVDSGLKRREPLRQREGGFALILPKKKLPDYLLPQEPDEPVDTVRCSDCGVTVARRVLSRHMREYHKPQPPEWVQPAVRRASTNRRGSVTEADTRPSPAQPREALCPRCGGDGGVRGGCGKCEGTGWVPRELERDSYQRPPLKLMDSAARISNANYPHHHHGAHYRERDGRIGTAPQHDDYDEESMGNDDMRIDDRA